MAKGVKIRKFTGRGQSSPVGCVDKRQGDGLRGFTTATVASVHVVVVQQSTEGGSAFDLVRRRGAVRVGVSQRNFVAESLMRTVLVVMAFDGFQGVMQMRFADQDEVVEGFAAFADKAFREGVALRRFGRRLGKAKG